MTTCACGANHEDHASNYFLVLFWAVSGQAVVVSPFVDVKTMINRSPDIVIAKCITIPGYAPSRFEDRVYPAKVEVRMVLKGEKRIGPTTIATLYRLEPDKTYLFCNSGGSACGTDFVSVAELSVVPVPLEFTISLEGKTLEQQMTTIYKYQKVQVDRAIRELQQESELLAKAVTLDRREELAILISQRCVNGFSVEIDGPLTVEQVEVESLQVLEDPILKRIQKDKDIKRVPFGGENKHWLALKDKYKEGDEMYFFRSDPTSWKWLCGSEGMY